jgi:hypothetical protein
MRIVSYPERVCFEHAAEFWTGLLVYARHPSDRREDHEPSCTCRSCEEVRSSDLRAIAIAAAGPPPRSHERVRMRLAS